MFKASLEAKLTKLYGPHAGKKVFNKLQKIGDKAKLPTKGSKSRLWDQTDVALITYPDSFSESGVPALKTLNKFLSTFVKKAFSVVHILPFYPYSADRGFSVIDYLAVKKEFGGWGDVKKIAGKYRLMADLVANHVSVQNKWFKGFTNGDKKYEDYFIAFDEKNLPTQEQIKLVRRGRATPLLNPFKTKSGVKYLWTTYSIDNLIDQIDLNYKNPDVLVEIVKVFLFYLKKGISVVRFDGVGGLWKELGTTCKHLPQAHLLVSVFREIIEELGANTLMFTETTTASPSENLSYMNSSEAHVSYNFSLAPLVLYSFYSGNSLKLSSFIKEMKTPSEGTTFFNVLDIHDGINLYAASYTLADTEIKQVITEVTKRGAEFSYRSLPSGESAVKEMNITWWSALSSESDDFETNLKRFLTSRAIALSLKGIPGIYYLSLFGAKNDKVAFTKTKHPRDINRTNLEYLNIVSTMADKNSREYRIFNGLLVLVNMKRKIPAFHPNAKQEVLNLDSRIFAILRGEGGNRVIALHNVSNETVNVTYKSKKYSLLPYSFIWQKI